jgi:hypothetical protein
MYLSGSEKKKTKKAQSSCVEAAAFKYTKNMYVKGGPPHKFCYLPCRS